MGVQIIDDYQRYVSTVLSRLYYLVLIFCSSVNLLRILVCLSSSYIVSLFVEEKYVT